MASKLERQHNHESFFRSREVLKQANDDETHVIHLEQGQIWAVYQYVNNNVQDCDEHIPSDSNKLLISSFDCGVHIPHLRTSHITFDENSIISFSRMLSFQISCEGNTHNVIELRSTWACLDSQCPTCDRNCPPEQQTADPWAVMEINADVTMNSISFPCVDYVCEEDQENFGQACCPNANTCEREDDCEDRPDESESCSLQISPVVYNGVPRFIVSRLTGDGREILGELNIIPIE